MPPASSAGSSRRKQGLPTVCLECYLRKVKCDRKRPCDTCIRRGTENLCKTFDTSELDAETLQKKQARRSVHDINAFLEARDTHDPDPQQRPPTLPSSSEHPMTTFLNHMLKDLNPSDETDSSSPRSPSLDPSIASAVPYCDKQSVAKMAAFCTNLPQWDQLAKLIRHYIWHVDWKFLITSQDVLETQMHDLWLRVIAPCQASNFHPSGSLSLLKHGDLSRLALLATIVGETIETMDPDSIADVLPVSPPGKVLQDRIKVEADVNPRVRALLFITHQIPILIGECVRLNEMTIDLVQANVATFSLWTNQGLHNFGEAADFPQWDVTMRAARGCKLFEDPSSSTGAAAKTRCELDHHRRLAWLVYGYDHAFAVGANTKPLIVEAQFSVDGPSDAPPYSASGSPPDACLAMLEVQGAKIAQMVSNTLCYGPPLHRKVMETDQYILSVMSRIHPSYAHDRPDTSLDVKDPFRARRRCWLQLTTAWQRGSLHRHCFFPNGRINNGELATSRHIATDSAIRSITGARELRRLQNRFSDYQGSAWYYQYLTEPNMTLATGALLLIRSKGRGVPGLADEANCWPTVMHFVKIIDESLQELNASIKDSSMCLASFLSFGQRCSQLIRQLRAAVQTSIDSLIKADPGIQSVIDVQVDESLLSLLHPRARNRSPLVAASNESSSGSGYGSASGTTEGIARRKRPRAASGKDTVTRLPRGQANQSVYGNNTAAPPSTASSQLSRSSTASSTSPLNLLTDLSPPHSTNVAWMNTKPAQGTHTQFDATSRLATAPQAHARQTSLDSMGLWLNPQTALPYQAMEEALPAPHLGVPVPGPTGDTLSSAEPSALQNYYSDDEIQRANEGRGLSDWIASMQMDLMLPQPLLPQSEDT